MTLVAATTENPFFCVISPLLSRSLLLTLEPLTDDDIRGVVADALERRARPGRQREPRRAGARPPGPARRWRRPPGADLPRGRRRRRGRARPGGRGPRDHRDGRGPGGGALRPAGRPALRRDQRLHQVRARLRRRRRAALPGPDDGGRGGPAVHRPPAGDPGQRGHRPGRPHGAHHRGRRRAGRRADRDARGPAHPGPGDDRAGPGAEVERRDHWRSRPPRPTYAAGRSVRSRRTCATRTTAARRSSATARATATPTTSPTASPSSSTPPTWSRTRRTTGRPRSAPRRRSRSGGTGSAG